MIWKKKKIQSKPPPPFLPYSVYSNHPAEFILQYFPTPETESKIF